MLLWTYAQKAETILKNQIRVAEISDPVMQKEMGRNLAVAAAQEITKSTNWGQLWVI